MRPSLPSLSLRALCILAFFGTSAPSLAASPEAAQRIVAHFFEAFRCDDLDVPAQPLWDAARAALGPTRLRELVRLEDFEVREALEALVQAGKVSASRGAAENLLKVHRLARQARRFRPLANAQGDVYRWPREALKPWLDGFPQTAAVAPAPARTFELGAFEVAELAKRSVLDNDFYNFKVAAGYWTEGFHETHESTFQLFTRGKKARPFFVFGGLELILPMLEQLRFSEREVRFLERHPDFQNVPVGFFDYLRKFRFRGSVRAMKSGTVYFANEPVLEVTGDPVEAQIVETLLLPLVNAVSATVTKAARISIAANGRSFFEGGTRRGYAGLLSAYGAYLGGAVGTSNVLAARLFGLPPLGTMNHAWVEHFLDEVESFAKMHALFPNTSFLIDNYEPIRGLRNAIRGTRRQLKTIRIDSRIAGKTMAETIAAVAAVLAEEGLPNVAITVSDGLDERSLWGLRDAPFQFALVGTELAAPSDANGLNVVYKLVEIVANGVRRPDPVKMAEGKVGTPGRKQIWRLFGADGRYASDLLTEEDEEGPVGGIPLLVPVMIGGRRVFAAERAADIRARVLADLPKLPRALLPADAPASYKVETSDRLLRRRNEAVLRCQQELAD